MGILRFVLVLFFLVSVQSFAQRGGGGGGGGESGAVIIKIFPERQQERRSTRWTLADWMATKREISRQNMWLAAHTNKLPVDLTYGFDLSRSRAIHELDFFIYWFGLRFRYLSNVSWFSASPTLTSNSGEIVLQLRLFGGNPQNTNLVFQAAYEYDHVQNPAAFSGAYTGFGLGPELQIYFAHWLGVRGQYRFRFSRGNTGNASLGLKGSSWNAIGFLEMGAFRLEGGWQSRTWDFTTGGTLANSVSEGDFVGGLRFFF